MQNKILALMSDTGGGHRSAAEAIAEAVHHEEENCQVKVIDLFAKSRLPVNQAARFYALNTVYFPVLWGWFWHSTNGRLRSRLLLSILKPFIVGRLKLIIQREKPSAVISVHPILSHAAADVLRELNWQIPFVVIVTDLANVHHTWICTQADQFIVPTLEARAFAIKNGVSANKIKVIGLPIRRKFFRRSDSLAEIRMKLQINPELFTVLLVGGGEGTGKIYDFSVAISEMEHELQLIVVAGRNRALRKKLEATKFHKPVQTYGFTDKMSDLMHASDIIVTRAGPGIISEALACGLPIIITGALPGQEEGNVGYILRNKAGRLAKRPSDLVKILSSVLTPESSELMCMRENSRRLGRPGAAMDIAKSITDFLGQVEDQHEF